MHKSSLFVFMYFCLLAKVLTAPVANNQYVCDPQKTLLKYELGNEYLYDYSTKTKLWINDVSEESKSEVELTAKVYLRAIQDCLFMLRISEGKLTGATINDDSVVKDLIDNPVQFRINSDGELDPNLDFRPNDKPWSRNIKRGILSALQLKAIKDLRSLEGQDKKSAVIYETDVLGRCRTTYSTKDNADSAQITLKKKKSLQRCTLNENSKTSAIQYQPYKNLPEFNKGKLFIESYECESKIQDGMIRLVECEEKSTYKIGSRGTKGVQAVVNQTLKYVEKKIGYDRMDRGPFTDIIDITFEYSDKSTDDLEYKNVDINKFITDVCTRTDGKEGLDDEHANIFRAVVSKLDTMSEADLLKFYQDSKAKCAIGGITASNAIIFANTDNSFQAILKLLDDNELSSQQYINEFPILTAMARNQDASLTLIQKFKAYIQAKKADFPYLRKTILIYSSLVKSYCKRNECNQALLDDLSSLVSANLGSDCSDSSKKDLVTVSLKAIGNIGFTKDNAVLVKCAKNKKNSMEVRVSALQAFRRIPCELIGQQYGIVEILKDTAEDAELRITAFQTMVKCSDSDRFKEAAKTHIPEFLEKEKDLQVLTYIVDYAKEHGLTLILNPILNNPRLKEKFSVNFKQLSWNNYHYKYSIMRDGAVEVDTSVIFDTKKAFLPRSIRLNVTTHMYGMSINFMDVTLRMEGLDEILRLAVIEKLRSADLVKRLMEKPETLIDILKIISDKLEYTAEKPYLSILIRIYGSDVFYSELDTPEKLKRLAEFIRSPRDKLMYNNVKTIRNMLLIESRVRQPLANGLEFNTFMDTSFALFISKKSSKTDVDGKRNFQVNNFYSSSLAINKRFEVQINKNNKIALKKKSILNTDFNVDLEGVKTNSSHSYTLNLRPNNELKLASLTGKFYKLTSSSEYKEVTKFSVEQYQSNKCTSDKFTTSVGVQLCLSIQRPKVGSLKNLLWPEQNPMEAAADDDDDDDEKDDDDDDDDDQDEADKKFKRPRLTLSGPYSYQITLKNPNQVKSLIYKSEFQRSARLTSYKGKLQSKSASGQPVDRLEINYLRKRNYTNLMMDRSISLEVKRPQDNDVRLKFFARAAFIKKQLIHLNFDIDNKILRDLDLNLEFKREKEENNVVPTYKIEALLDSKLRTNKYKKFAINLKPSNRNINGDFVIEYSDERTNNQVSKIASGLIKLTATQENGIEYDVDITADTRVPSKSRLYGKVSLNMLKSNIDLNFEHDGVKLDLAQPANLKLGHEVDASGTISKVQTFAHLKVNLPNKKIDHGARIILEANPVTMRPSYLEVQVNTVKTAENSNLPYTVYIGKRVTTQDSKTTTEYLAGLKNFNIDLSKRAESGLVRALYKADNSYILKAVSLSYSRVNDQSQKSRVAIISVKKNDASLANIETNLSGSFKNLRETPGEVPKQTMAAKLKAKIFDYAGGAELTTTLESSASTGKHGINLEAKLDNFFRILVKLVSVKWNLQVDVKNKKIDGELEIAKMGEVKWRLKTVDGALSTSGDNKEFNVYYERTAAGNKESGSGKVTCKWTNIKNFEATANIPDVFRFNLAVDNDRDSAQADLGSHEFYLKYAHLGALKEEREFKVVMNNKTEGKLKKIVVNVMAKKGAANELDKIDSLSYLIDMNTDNTFMIATAEERTLVEGKNTFSLKLKQFNIDLGVKSNIKLDIRAKKFTFDSDMTAKFPAIVSDPGKLNSIEEKITYTIDLANQQRTLKGSLKTDNKLIGKYFKVLNVDYTRKTVASGLFNQNHNIDLNVDLTTADDQTKNLKAKIERFSCKEDSDDMCQGTKAEIKQNIMPKYKKRLSEGEIDITECTAYSKLARVKTDEKYLLEVASILKCLNEAIVDNQFLVSRNRQTRETRFRLNLDSLAKPKRSIEFAHKKFNKKDGLFHIAATTDKVDFSTKLSYERQANETNGKLIKGTYKLETSFGPNVTKTCEMNIESKTNYYNKLSCSVKTPKLPVKLNYGYSLKVNNKRDLLFGKRDIELDLNLPSSRIIKLQYVASHAIQIDAITPEDDDTDNDDNDEENNDREFNATLTYFWDHGKQPSKFVKINAKRENLEKGVSKMTVDFLNYPKLKLFRVEVDRKRSFNQTELGVALSYETELGQKNRLDIDSIMSSDRDSISFSVEANVQRPKLNLLYANQFERLTGRLQLLELRFANLIKLRIDKEADPENRRISVELVNPEGYTADSTSTDKNGIYKVESQLKKSGTQLAKLQSTFDSNNNVLNVILNDKYQLNLGVDTEKLADLSIVNLKENNKKLATGIMRVYEGDDDINYLELNLKWNRFWATMKKEILKDQNNDADANPQFNSYLGDKFGVISKDLKSGYDAMAEERALVKKDCGQLLFILGDFYSHFLSSERRAQLAAYVEQKMKERKEADAAINALPFHKRVYKRYNQVSEVLTKVYMKVRSISKRLARRVPKLPKIEYNSSVNGFDNNVIITRATRHAENLYQANAIYRNGIRKLAERFLNAKGNLVRNTKAMSTRALINKYKYRPLNSYTVAGLVFNRRNVIRFNGQPRILKTSCKYLLTHDLAKNRFSVILNNNRNDEGVLSVYAYGRPAIEINGESAFISSKKIALPYSYTNKDKDADLTVSKIHNGVRLEIEDELLVECYHDSHSCVVGLTRFSTGKVNGLLGRSKYDADTKDEDYWFVDSQCKMQANKQPITPNREAIKTCYHKFARHRNSIFKDAFGVIKPNCWQKICETALSVDHSKQCSLMKAFYQFARIQKVDIDVPDECYQCKANQKSYYIGQTIENAQNAFEQSSDFVFVLLPCDYNKNFNDLLGNIQKITSQLASNRYHFVYASHHQTSVYQDETGKSSNFDIKKALQTIAAAQAGSNVIDKKDLYKAFFMAGSLFGNRLAANRFMVIISCGNCIDYDMMATLKLSKVLKARNIVVSSWGDYKMHDLDGSLENEHAVGYGYNKIFLNKDQTSDVDVDSLEGYRVEHNQDLCGRLAAKTKGAVFDINQLKDSKIFQATITKLRQVRPTFDHKIDRCERVSTPMGDMADFNFKRTARKSDDVEEDADDDDI